MEVLKILLFTYCYISNSNTKKIRIKYPYIVLIRTRDKLHHLCTGSLISLQWVLTSVQKVEGYIKNPSDVIATRLNVTRSVEYINYHKGYNARTFEHDIALILLDEPFEKTEFVDICRIPIFPMDIEMNIKCAEVQVIGFDSISLNIFSNKVLSNKECEKYVMYDPKKISFCATTGLDESCMNDIGGPAICEGFVFGITSYGCSPGVFTRIDKHLKFIFDTMGPSSLLRISPEEEVKRSRQDFIIAVTTSVIILICVLIILLCSVGVSEKLKCWKKSK